MVRLAAATHAAPATASDRSNSLAASGDLTLTPPDAVRARRRLRASRARFFTPHHLFRLGLTRPAHPRTSRAATPRPGTGTTLSSTALPASVDLSADAPLVGNQGPVNSCASWATGYTLLGWYAHHAHLAGAPYAPMYAYSQLVHGVNTGTTFEGNFGIEEQGIDTQADYTQGNYDYTDLPTAAEQANARQYHITGYAQVYNRGSGNAQQAIETALAAGQPVVVGIPVYSNFMNATAAAPFVDVPPAVSTLYGGQGIVAMAYDANGLWIENQWTTSWGLHGWAELSWAFVNQYLWSAYTISGFQAPGVTGPLSSPTVTSTPSAGARLWTSPASALPGSTFTIDGSGFGPGSVLIYWNGRAVAQVGTNGGAFSLHETLAANTPPGSSMVSASNAATGAQVTTTFTVLSASPSATATTVPASPTASPTRTSVPPTATNTPVPPTATSTPVPPTATATSSPAAGATLALNPGSGLPGLVLTISGSGFHPFENVTIYWNGSMFATVQSSSAGTFSRQLSIAPSAAPGQRAVSAVGTGGDSATATFTILSSSGPSATPTQQAGSPTATATQGAAASPTATPTQPAASPTPASGIPTSGTTSNGCQITPDQASGEQYLFTLLNQHRAAAGAPPLQLNETIAVASRQHSCDMFLHQQLSHTGSDGSSPFQRISSTGVTFSTAGENIGMAGGYSLTGGINAIDSSMMGEPLSYGNHHWNIVNSAYTQVGIGIIYANNQVWLTEDFIG